MEGNYPQKSMYPAFILTLLTPLLFTTFPFVTLLFSYPRISYFTLIPFLFFMLCLILCCIISSYIRVSSYFYSSSLLHYYTFLREFDHANHEAYSTKTNTNCVNLMLYYDSRWQCFRYNCCSPLDCGMFRPERCFAPGLFARIGIYVCADKENWCPRDNFFVCYVLITSTCEMFLFKNHPCKLNQRRKLDIRYNYVHVLYIASQIYM